VLAGGKPRQAVPSRLMREAAQEAAHPEKALVMRRIAEDLVARVDVPL
jgi:hypothetical protein